MVFQNYALYPHMTVRENMGFALKLAKTEQSVIDEKVQEAARILDLTQHLDRKPANLSGGQRQRVAMGRAIVRNPKAFLMDEPLSNLDAKLRVQMRTEVSRIQQRLGTTTVYVTHDQTEAMTLGDRVAVMRSGALQQVGTPRELYTQPINLFVAGFIGSPAMNFLSGQIDGKTLQTPLGKVTLDKPPAGGSRKVVVGIRPEDFEDATIAAERGHTGSTFTTEIDVLESMGAESFAYFKVEAERVGSEELAELAQDSGRSEVPGGEPGEVVARIDAASQIRQGGKAKLWFNPHKLHLFDADTGAALG
jgi:multiple sugar transport system ATP-binding protein